ncbi:uncharacterized protein HKW66_Vig0228340 [Vigna angularis]|uniref:Uncharacterized protein n=1 Tax=Phaseolus angularis TaxID=3914 RepID=A0A8T0KBD2_PHAAN|nr:uncharacterized protein HKW66_Vig0228340 [Vigna angularis]
MLSFAKRFQLRPLTTPFLLGQLRYARTRPKSPPVALRKTEERSKWWALDGEMHEIGDHVPLRERFVIPRENIPNKRRKQLREQFMRRTRLVLKESDQTFGRNRQPDNLEKVSVLRDKFEYDRERRMREKAFAPMHRGYVPDSRDSNRWNQPLDTDRYFSQIERR